MLVMATIPEVVDAFAGIERAWEHYRETLRSALQDGSEGTQAEIGRRLGRSREQLRRDAMSASEREALILTEVERKRGGLPDGVRAYRDGKTIGNPNGRTWYEFNTVRKFTMGMLSIIDQAGNVQTEGTHRVFGYDRAAVLRVYERLRADGWLIDGADGEETQ
jgi:CRP-like cAMP-binding protein